MASSMRIGWILRSIRPVSGRVEEIEEAGGTQQNTIVGIGTITGARKRMCKTLVFIDKISTRWVQEHMP